MNMKILTWAMLCITASGLFSACDDEASDDYKAGDTGSVGDTGADTESDSSIDGTLPSIAMVVTTDYSTGALSTVNVNSHVVDVSRRVVHSDSVCRFDAVTKNMYLVSRFGADAVTVLSQDGNLSVLGQFSVEAGTNAQDIAVISKERAIVPRLGSSELLVVHPTLGTEIQRIDISAYADADGVPDAAQALRVGETVFVTLQRMDSATWAVAEYSSVLMLDGATGAISGEVKLTATNPTGKLRYSEAAGGIVLAETGAYGVMDGGIEVMDSTGGLSGLKVTETVLGGDVTDAVIATATKGYAVISVPGDNGSNTHLVSFNPQTGARLATLIVSDGFNLGYLELFDDSELWVSDRTPTAPGIRVFNVEDDSEATEGPVNVGLPPSMVCFGN